MKETVGNFLLRRLEEAGVRHIFGVPGDYNLELLQQLEDRGSPSWVGNCNELNGSYAADGYARINGLGALIVTNGVGALSAINGIAGAYCEHVPVVCICGTIPARAVQRGDLMHHTLADREKGNFYRAFAEVTTAQAVLSVENAAAEIDRLIQTAWRRKLPVYMELPSDLACLEIEVPERPLDLTMPASDPERLEACTTMILDRVGAAKSPAFLLDLDADRFGLSQSIAELANRFQMQVATLSTSKGVFPETSPLFAGGYAGIASTPETREAVEKSDCLIAIGYRRVELVSGFFTDELPPTTIYLNADSVADGEHDFQGVQLEELMDSLVRSSQSVPRKEPAPAEAPSRAAAGAPSDGALTQAGYWKAMQGFLRPGDVILVEDGTSIVGAGALDLPEGCTYISQAVWGSIGYTVGALLGAMLAAPDRRHILFVGEGSFQLTAQELSTILRHGLKPFIFLINNGGYTVERTILGKDAAYNDVANWRYSDLPKVFRRDSKAETYVVETVDELDDVLGAEHVDLVFVESVMDKHDAPIDVIRGGHAFANSDYGPRGPQFAPDAQVPLPS
ncbi:alpha-keto acid decarboxylase family protein [Vulgatibacter incomptus]|uniref:Pyruvate decarboxylase n=1 Tax=Vulgatibacter incomptus TaxID=1391653 RepID=A0A0K1PFN9_9BACT|nr:thiamine pyrophosphate-binding protein [Vulgatibacter incomptus]AKU92322.1 Pyruvate decarboxylase [Vulgatibacter incomptus]